MTSDAEITANKSPGEDTNEPVPFELSPQAGTHIGISVSVIKK